VGRCIYPFVVDWPPVLATGERDDARQERFVGSSAPDFENLKVSVDAGTQYDRLREHLAPPARAAWDEILLALFWWGDEGGHSPVQDLAGRRDEFYLTMSDSTAMLYHERMQRADWASLRAAYRQAKADPRFDDDFSQSRWIPDEEAFIAYLSSWAELLARAAGQHRGILIE
jgi:hypothetical protein